MVINHQNKVILVRFQRLMDIMHLNRIGPSLKLVILKIIFLQQVFCSVLEIQIYTPSLAVCKDQNVDMNWYLQTDEPIKVTQWQKKSIPTDLLIMSYIKASDSAYPTDKYKGRVERTETNAGLRIKESNKADSGEYYVKVTVDFGNGDSSKNYVKDFMDKSVSLQVLEGVNYGLEAATLSLELADDNETLICTGPTTLGDATLAIVGPDGKELVTSTTNTTVEVNVGTEHEAGEYLCRAYFPSVEYQDAVQGGCLPIAASYYQYIAAENKTAGPCEHGNCAKTASTNVGLVVGMVFLAVTIVGVIVIVLFIVYKRLQHQQYKKNTTVEIVPSNSPRKETLEISKPLRAEELGIHVRDNDSGIMRDDSGRDSPPHHPPPPPPIAHV